MVTSKGGLYCCYGDVFLYIIQTIKLSAVEKLTRHVDGSQLTEDLGGFLPYNHTQWLSLRQVFGTKISLSMYVCVCVVLIIALGYGGVAKH